MSILKKLLNKSLYQTGGVKFVKTVTPKPKQTSSYTPSDTTVKVIDPKTGRPLYYDPTYDALFDPTTGNQLDSDDHRDIREVGKGGNRVKQAALIQNKRNELQTKGITSEYASRYRPGESEKIALLLNSRFGDTEKKGIILGTPYQETKNHGDYATSVDGSDIVSKADYIVKGDYLKDDISDVESALKMQFGLPQSNKDKATNSYIFDISDDRPTIGAQRDYYFKPVILPKVDKNIDPNTLKMLNEQIFNQDAFDKYIIKIGKDLPVGKNTVVTTPYAHMGNTTISHGINEDGVHYSSISDDWDLDPQKGYYGAVNLLPNSTYYNMLDKIGFPKSDQKLAVERFKAGDDLATILKYNNAKPKEGSKPVSGGIPIYYRSYYDEKTGKPIKIKNKFTTGGTTETQSLLPKKVVKLDGKYVEVYIDTNKKPIFATSNEIDNSKIRKTTLGDEYDLEGTTYLLNSQEPAPVANKLPETIIAKPKVPVSDNNNPTATSIDNPVSTVKAPVIKVNEEVVNLQEMLNKTLVDINLKQDGILGGKTKEAIKKYANNYESIAALRDTYPSLISYFPKLKEEVKVDNEEIKAFQKSLGMSNITGTVTPETIQVYEKLIIDGFNTPNNTLVNTKSKTKIDPNDANKEITTTTSDEFSDVIKRFIINTPEAIRQKSSIVAISRVGISGNSIEEMNKNFAKIYLQNPTNKTYKNIVTRFPSLQQYINAEKKYSTNSYAYGGYSKRFI